MTSDDLGLLPRPWQMSITGEQYPWQGDRDGEDVVVVKNQPVPGLLAGSPTWQRKEAYRLEIVASRPEITAEGELGVANARRTLRQLRTSRTVPDLVITDRPEFEWRGLSVDIARHFFGVEDLVAVMDIMAELGLNRLHLHLSDDQGWRIEIPAIPELTERSSRTSVGGGPGGFLSQEDLDFLVAQGAHRGIAIVPEVDVPGHVTAALHALPGLNPDGAQPDVYEGIEVGISSLTEDLPETERFLEGVFGTLVPHGQEGVHIGGDECLLTPAAEFNRLVASAAGYVRAAGRPVIAWQEAAPVLEEGEYLQVWDERQDLSGVVEAARRGVRIIASPATRVYLDMKYADDERLGLTWAGTTTLREAYEWDPRALFEGLDPAAVHGVEACIFTETIETQDELLYMLMPRLAAVAEVAWAGTGIGTEGQWESFEARVRVRELWRPPSP